MDDVTIRPAAGRETKAAPVENSTGTVPQDALAAPEAPSGPDPRLSAFVSPLRRPGGKRE